MSVSSSVRRHMAEGGWIRRMFDEGIALKQKYGERNVFDLSLGNPVAEPPLRFRDLLKRQADDPSAGLHRYMPNPGYPETRAAVAEHLKSETGLLFTANEVLMTCGAAGAINVALKAVLEPGDEVITFAPFFSEYAYYIDNHRGIMKAVPTDGRFLPDISAFEKAIGPKTRAVIVNSPNNPTGAVYGAETFEAIASALGRAESRTGRPVYLISDDVYRRLVYDGATSPWVFKYHKSSIVATSHSKDLALPGERIGYLAINPGFEGRKELFDALVFCNRVLGFVNAPALMQRIVRDLQGEGVDVAEYRRKRDLLYEGLTGVGYRMVKPQGAFYMFPRSPMADDLAFIGELKKHNVLAVPGVGFGMPGYFRISYCVDDWVIEGALKGFLSVARSLAVK